MSIKKITIDEFLKLRTTSMVLDVRSPSEFAEAHILGAQSLPLFSDDERKVVGTAYKQESKEDAIKIGLDYFGTKMRGMVEHVEEIMRNGKDEKVIIHCWRGGMRSAGVAWLLDLYGLDVEVLIGGYKSYRKWVHEQFEKAYNFHILSGYTGSGKTVVLHEMKANDQQVIDLEGLAIHRGSAFGGMKEAQPTQEMFENKLAEDLDGLSANNDPIWIEDESQRIGNLNLPPSLWETMRIADLFFLDVSFEDRLDHITEEYGVIDNEELINATTRIQKRLGGVETKTCIECFQNDNKKEAFGILLKYYDKHYLKAFKKRDLSEDEIERVKCDTVNGKANSEKLLECKNKK